LPLRGYYSHPDFCSLLGFGLVLVTAYYRSEIFIQRGFWVTGPLTRQAIAAEKEPRYTGVRSGERKSQDEVIKS
jgi:hypothetical protein